ncbi:MAG: cytoplasmic protein [Proteobacteria bacterium]|nr:cytoplasmic protein [Pseudomonadota bacterium]
MSIHTHNFVETYKGLVGYGADRETDENTVVYYLQKFSDDRFMEMMTKRMTDAELLELFELINRLLRKHLTESEYHTLFLKDDHDHED